jgi:hypothetical protein
MLIIKININEKEIDEIHIWNTGICTNPLFNIWKYKILKPEGFEDWSIYHNRDKGYLPLLAQVTEILTKHGDNND